MRKLILVMFIGAAIVTVHVPFLTHFAGDAQVHLAFAESFVQGRPFQYNINDSLVMASSSPFWTLLLLVFFALLGPLTPIAIKVTSVVCWVATTYLLYKVSRDVYNWSSWGRIVLLAVWLTNTAIIANALGGLENILSAVQLLLIYFLCILAVQNLSWRISTGLGFLLGWATLTRLDGAVFAGTIVLSVFVVKSMVLKNRRRKLLGHLVLILLLSVLVILPWYAYQYSLTGQVVSDSVLARFYEGRRTAVPLLKGILYFHTKTMLTLGTVFFPLAVGSVLALKSWRKWVYRVSNQTAPTLIKVYPLLATIIVLFIGIFFYTFVVGAEHFGRYFLPVFPFFFLLGFTGLWSMLDTVSKKHPVLLRVVVVLVVCYLMLGSCVDFHRRVFLGRHFSVNLLETVRAPERRVQTTNRYLEKFGVAPGQSVGIAMREVQLRYFVDDRINVLSLDGRASTQILDYIDKDTGMPDFDQYLEQTKPDFIQLGQWCIETGWTRTIAPKRLAPNLLCDWERQVGSMKVGERYAWKGRLVELVAPSVVRVNWSY